MNCKKCSQCCQKWGRQHNGVQRYYCKGCKKCQQKEYKYVACEEAVTDMIPKLICESVSVRGISRILRIAIVTVAKQIKRIANSIRKPAIPIMRKFIELDEVRTYIGNKELSATLIKSFFFLL